MIYDGLAALPLYRGLYRGLDVLMDWLERNDPAVLPCGRHEIDGARVFALVQDAQTKRPEDARYETHRRYMDVQVDLQGAERFRTTPGPVVPAGPFDEAADKGYCLPAPENDDILEGELGHGRFALFVPGEPHMPNLVIPGQEPGPIHKVCFKLLANADW